MIKSKGWKWEILEKSEENIWKKPSIESFYLLNKWVSESKKDFLDLGCGLGRHTVLFASNRFNTSAFDISEKAIDQTKKWCKSLNLKVSYTIGDMLKLPYKDNYFDCILCRNVISHTDTEGVKNIAEELYRVLKENGECYFTLGSKDTWGFKQDWPLIDENTKEKRTPGPEYGVPHFYADYELIKDIFKKFKIEMIYQVEDFYENKENLFEEYHYHVLIRK